MIFTSKISGTRVDGFDIVPLFNSQVITLKDCMERVHRQETMNWILDTLRFTKGRDNNWYATIDFDTDYKLAVMENYPEYEKEFIDYFGTHWMRCYIRFNH